MSPPASSSASAAPRRRRLQNCWPRSGSGNRGLGGAPGALSLADAKKLARDLGPRRPDRRLHQWLFRHPACRPCFTAATGGRRVRPADRGAEHGRFGSRPEGAGTASPVGGCPGRRHGGCEGRRCGDPFRRANAAGGDPRPAAGCPDQGRRLCRGPDRRRGYRPGPRRTDCPGGAGGWPVDHESHRKIAQARRAVNQWPRMRAKPAIRRKPCMPKRQAT